MGKYNYEFKRENVEVISSKSIIVFLIYAD